jgi:L-rhamnonate dehydratase
MPDRIDSCRRIKERTQIPLSGAEHEYTRWGDKRIIDADALEACGAHELRQPAILPGG